MNRILSVLAVATCFVASLWAQNEDVKIISTATVRNVTMQEVQFSKAGTSIEGTFIVPNNHKALAPIVMSHRYMVTEARKVDLLPFALTLAKAGSAVIVLHRTLEWPVKDDAQVRSGSPLLRSAEKWLINSHDVDVRRFAYIGPRFSDASTGELYRFSQEDGVKRGIWIPMAEPDNAKTSELLLTSEGQLEVAHWIQNQLELSRIMSIE